MGDEGGGESREALFFRTWLRLEDHEAAHAGEPYATVLHLRKSRPKARVEELAREFGALVGAPVPPATFRKLLQRARRKFLDLLGEQGYHFPPRRPGDGGG